MIACRSDAVRSGAWRSRRNDGDRPSVPACLRTAFLRLRHDGGRTPIGSTTGVAPLFARSHAAWWIIFTMRVIFS